MCARVRISVCVCVCTCKCVCYTTTLLMGVSWVLHGCFMGVSWVLHGVSRVFYSVVSKVVLVFEGCLNGASLCLMVLLGTSGVQSLIPLHHHLKHCKEPIE